MVRSRGDIGKMKFLLNVREGFPTIQTVGQRMGVLHAHNSRHSK